MKNKVSYTILCIVVILFVLGELAESIGRSLN